MAGATACGWTAMRPRTRILFSLCPRMAVLGARSAPRNTGNQPRGSAGYQGAEPLGWLASGFSPRRPVVALRRNPHDARNTARS